MTRPDDAALRAILAAGIAAPSAENRHHLRLHLGDDAVAMEATGASAWPGLPHRRWLALMACGAVIENMALRSAALGWQLEAEVEPEPAQPARVAWLRWTPRPDAAPDPLAAAIEARHTNRRFFRPGQATPLALRGIEQAVRQVPGAGLAWLDTRALRRRALRAIRLAETERFRRERLHRELYQDIRFDVGWRASAEAGIPPGALQVEFGARRAFQHLGHWRAMRAAALLGAATMLGWRAGYLPCALAPHLGLITGASRQSAAHVVAAGRAFQRAWLAATQAGLALQPMAAATVLSVQQPGDGWVSPEAQARLQQALHGLAPSPVAEPYMLFRLGHAPAPDVVASRPPIEQFLTG